MKVMGPNKTQRLWDRLEQEATDYMGPVGAGSYGLLPDPP
jgi:hypothetical protein